MADQKFHFSFLLFCENLHQKRGRAKMIFLITPISVDVETISVSIYGMASLCMPSYLTGDVNRVMRGKVISRKTSEDTFSGPHHHGEKKQGETIHQFLPRKHRVFQTQIKTMFRPLYNKTHQTLLGFDIKTTVGSPYLEPL